MYSQLGCIIEVGEDTLDDDVERDTFAIDFRFIIYF